MNMLVNSKAVTSQMKGLILKFFFFTSEDRLLVPPPRVSDSLVLGWGLRISFLVSS